MRNALTAALIFALVAMVPGVFAQTTTGGVQGVARDAQQQTLAKHTVQIRNVQTGQLAGTGTTNAAGQFTFAGLNPGSYVVEIVSPSRGIVGTTAPIAVASGTMATVTVTASAAGALDADDDKGWGIFGMGPIASAAVIGAAAVGVTVGVAMRDHKVTICHKPAGVQPQTIEISESAKQSHLNHGDTPGACPASPAR